MANIGNYINCCGIKEIDGVTGQRPETILSDICQNWFDDTPRAFAVFSQAHGKTSGHNLVKYIRTNKLGTVYPMKRKTNPNTGNALYMWVWAVNNVAFKRLATKKGWYEKHENSYGW